MFFLRVFQHSSCEKNLGVATQNSLDFQFTVVDCDCEYLLLFSVTQAAVVCLEENRRFLRDPGTLGSLLVGVCNFHFGKG